MPSTAACDEFTLNPHRERNKKRRFTRQLRRIEAVQAWTKQKRKKRCVAVLSERSKVGRKSRSLGTCKWKKKCVILRDERA